MIWDLDRRLTGLLFVARFGSSWWKLLDSSMRNGFGAPIAAFIWLLANHWQVRCLCKAGSACEGSCRQETQAELAGQARGARSIPRLSEWYASRMSAALTSTAFSATLPPHSYSCRARALLSLRRPLTSQGIQQSSCRTHSRQRSTRLQSSDKPALDSADRQSLGVASAGEDAAFFDASKQSRGAWTFFTAELAIVLGILYVEGEGRGGLLILFIIGCISSCFVWKVWIDPNTGVASRALQASSRVTESPELTMLAIYAAFALIHSGGASIRTSCERVIGARAYRVIFAALSLPLAMLAVVYWVNHRYDGEALWNLRRAAGVHEITFLLNFISFYFLYPSTFNLLEVAAVDEPKVHLWETGIIRITRHPQMVGQGLWCLAHTLWIGSTFTAFTSALLMAHHVFGCWHGDRRQRARYGEAFEEVKGRTSVLPFQAIIEGRQQLPADYYKEFLRLPYLTITALIFATYWAHPLIQAGSSWLGW